MKEFNSFTSNGVYLFVGNVRGMINKLLDVQMNSNFNDTFAVCTQISKNYIGEVLRNCN